MRKSGRPSNAAKKLKDGFYMSISITYDNYCVADSSGITSYVDGECCD